MRKIVGPMMAASIGGWKKISRLMYTDTHTTRWFDAYARYWNWRKEKICSAADRRYAELAAAHHAESVVGGTVWDPEEFAYQRSVAQRYFPREPLSWRHPHSWLWWAHWRLEDHGPRATRNTLRWFWQRGRRGYADVDWWEWDRYHARLMVRVLTEFRDHGVGYPGQGEADTPERWQAILDEMITGFSVWANAETPKASDYPGDKEGWLAAVRSFDDDTMAALTRSMELFTQWYPSMWD